MGKKYIDGRGWQYQVMPGIAAPPYPNYKARYQKPGSASWRCVAALPWRLTEEDAQSDLDQLAAKKGWTEMEDCEDE